MPLEVLTELQYSQDQRGPWKIYVYEPNSEYHRGGVWFRKGLIKYPEEEITAAEAKERADWAIKEGREVRICDSGDMLVFNSRGGEILYPPDPEAFWKATGAV
jgi:hypothetical protein